MPVSGYETVTVGTRPDGYHEIYLCPYGRGSRARQEGIHLADCNTRDRIVHREVFDGPGAALLRQPNGALIVMDEIGFMENGAESFCRAVLDCLDGPLPVLAAVRLGVETPFLRQVMEHPKARCCSMSPERFEELYRELRPLVLSWDRAWREARRP